MRDWKSWIYWIVLERQLKRMKKILTASLKLFESPRKWPIKQTDWDVGDPTAFLKGIERKWLICTELFDNDEWWWSRETMRFFANKNLKCYLSFEMTCTLGDKSKQIISFHLYYSIQQQQDQGEWWWWTENRCEVCEVIYFLLFWWVKWKKKKSSCLFLLFPSMKERGLCVVLTTTTTKTDNKLVNNGKNKKRRKVRFL